MPVIPDQKDDHDVIADDDQDDRCGELELLRHRPGYQVNDGEKRQIETKYGLVLQGS